MSAWKTKHIALLVICACGSGCACGGESTASNDSFDRAGMLANIGDNILIPVYDEFAASAQLLEESITAYCAALGDVGEAEALTAARDAWTQTIQSWQVAEAVLLGPAAMNERTLRDQVYSWPLTSTCAVDQEVDGYRAAPDSVDIEVLLNNSRGLDAVEYLLWAPSLDHTCTSETAPAGWNDLPEADRKAARCGFASLAAIDVSAKADVIVQAWSPDGGDFIGDLKRAGQSDSSFQSTQEAVNVVSDALFYVDTDVKDMKLAEPAGITDNSCGTALEPCFDELESPFSDVSKSLIQQNLIGFELVFSGSSYPDRTNGIGFDDFLIELGAPDVATTIAALTLYSETQVSAIPGSLREGLVSDPDSVEAAYEATRVLSNILKSQFLTVLGLDAPGAAAGDND